MNAAIAEAENSPSDNAGASKARATTGIWSMCSNSDSMDSLSTSNTEKARSPPAAGDYISLVTSKQ